MSHYSVLSKAIARNDCEYHAACGFSSWRDMCTRTILPRQRGGEMLWSYALPIAAHKVAASLLTRVLAHTLTQALAVARSLPRN